MGAIFRGLPPPATFFRRFAADVFFNALPCFSSLRIVEHVRLHGIHEALDEARAL